MVGTFPAFSTGSLAHRTLYAVRKAKLRGINVSSSAAVAVPIHFALPALETILREFAQEPGRASLALNVRQLHLPFEATICVGIKARVSSGETRNEWHLQISAARNPRMYPTFDGVLTLIEVADSGSQLLLSGTYVVPFGALGRAIDVTLLRGAATSSLERFSRELAYRLTALAHWATD